MTKEYKDSIREGFENHIAKQQKLETISKAVLAVQVFAMNANLEYIDKKLQTQWGEWEDACSQQIEKDAKLIENKVDEILKNGVEFDGSPEKQDEHDSSPAALLHAYPKNCDMPQGKDFARLIRNQGE